jgi:hypothetical protein
MAFGEETGGRLSPFERLLEALDDEDPPPERGVFPRAAQFWPASPTQAKNGFYTGGAVENLYVETLYVQTLYVQTLGPERISAPEKADLTANFADIGRELARTQSLTGLRQLRRRCALLLHPDRVPSLDRSLAENFMAEVNAAIDRAIKSKTTVTQTP